MTTPATRNHLIAAVAAAVLALAWTVTRIGVTDLLRAESADELEALLAVELAAAAGQFEARGAEAPGSGSLHALLRVARHGSSGEAYLFDASGRALTPLRFAELAARAGAGEPVSLRDPGGSVEDGHRPDHPWEALPLTRLMQAALAGRGEGRGKLDAPYRNYAGREVLGAWGWIEGSTLGIAVEIGAPEVLAPRRYVDFAFLSMLAVAGIGWLVYAGTFGAAASTQVGPYRLGRRIGEGAMSNVFLARHEMLGRTCAVKVLKLQAQSDELLKRFEREARLAGQLRHPNIVEIYDYGLAPDGALYYAMELVDGMTLTQMVEGHGPAHPARAVRLLRQTCAAIAEMHGQDMLHRDIKPENLMACARPREWDVIKLLDFGLIKSLSGSDTRDLTRFVRVLGTPAWMAPERLSDPGNVDTRSDLYSIGAIGFFLLTGRRPFESGAEQDLVQQVLHVEAPRASEHSPFAVPPELDELIARCLAKDPEQRPAGAAAMLAALDAVAATCPWKAELARLWWAGLSPHVT